VEYDGAKCGLSSALSASYAAVPKPGWEAQMAKQGMRVMDSDLHVSDLVISNNVERDRDLIGRQQLLVSNLHRSASDVDHDDATMRERPDPVAAGLQKANKSAAHVEQAALVLINGNDARGSFTLAELEAKVVESHLAPP